MGCPASPDAASVHEMRSGQGAQVTYGETSTQRNTGNTNTTKHTRLGRRRVHNLTELIIEYGDDYWDGPMGFESQSEWWGIDVQGTNAD